MHSSREGGEVGAFQTYGPPQTRPSRRGCKETFDLGAPICDATLSSTQRGRDVPRELDKPDKL